MADKKKKRTAFEQYKHEQKKVKSLKKSLQLKSKINQKKSKEQLSVLSPQ